MKRNSHGVTLTELLISLVVITISLIPVINYFNATLRQNNEAREMTKIRFRVEEEMEKIISLNYRHPSLEALGSNQGISRFDEYNEYLIKTTVLFLDPETGLVPENYPLRIKDDTNLKQITISAARKDKLGGQVNMVYIKSP